MFLIGSCAGVAELNDWYQDFDVHMLLEDGAVPLGQLDTIRVRLNGLLESYGRRGAHIAWDIRDRHWKLVPDESAGVNLSVHATLANRFDFQRRALHHRVLAWNMYGQSEVLFGDSPVSILPIAPAEPLQHLYAVGGIGWMVENFHRAVWLLLTEPDRQTFYPYIGGYCWNVVSSLMLQHYSLATGRVTTRRGALDHLVREALLDADRRRDVELLLEHKTDPHTRADEVRLLVNAAARVVAALGALELARLGIDREAAAAAVPGGPVEHFAEDLAAARGGVFEARQLHLWIDGDEPDFLDAFEGLVADVRSRYANVTPLEHFEAVERAMDDGWSELTKVTVWSQWNAVRLMLASDFARDRGQPTIDSALWGWETGIQALLQRLHELYIRRGGGDAERALARAAVHVASRQHAEVGLGRLEAPPDDFGGCCELLGRALAPHAVPLA